MRWGTVNREAIDGFLKRHPGIPLPEGLASVSLQFDGRGDVVSYEAWDQNGRAVSLESCLTPAFSSFLERVCRES